jgi:predicted dehydrogenase
VRVQAALDGGAFMDVGCYALNAARFLFDAEPVEVTALWRLDPELGVDTSFAALARFPGDRLALLDGSFNAIGTQRYEIAGFRGSIVVDPAFQPGSGEASIRLDLGENRHVITVAGVDQYALEADHFARSVRTGRLLPPAEDGRAQARAIDALYRSAETGRAVRL